ncbi:hypothetical protein DXG01_009368 [Tephrocybe rancida]|nr:hypothetical protein DXG01_009368 [Tephrocybe rancida]
MLRDEAVDSLVANGFPYSRKLFAHTSCVNALAFSSGDGRFLASGGDDYYTYLWDFHQEDVKIPIHTLHGPKGNIFTLAFSAANHYMYSGGTDETILKYDVSTLGQVESKGTQGPHRMLGSHDETIRAISCHPFQEEMFFSAGNDGRIILHDGRDNDSVRAQNTIQLTAEATGVQCHPTMEHIFATSDSRGDVCLRDTRMAFGPLSTRSRDGVVQRYVTKLTRKTFATLARAEASSITFNSDGSKLAVTMLNFYPTIYGLSDPHPLAVCTGKNHPDGTPVLLPERPYSNSCTIKNGAFGNFGMNGAEFYGAGSEDFRGYVWKVPSTERLADQRLEVSADDWASQDWSNTTAFTNGREEPCYIPVDLSTPHCYLHGHSSIVNSTLFHPHLLHIVTCGIEQDIVLHSASSTSPCAPDLQRTSTDVRTLDEEDHVDRAVYYRMLAGIESHDVESEVAAIRMFDHILREEGNTDVFDIRGRMGEDSSDDEPEHMSSDDDGNWW